MNTLSYFCIGAVAVAFLLLGIENWVNFLGVPVSFGLAYVINALR